MKLYHPANEMFAPLPLCKQNPEPSVATTDAHYLNAGIIINKLYQPIFIFACVRLLAKKNATIFVAFKKIKIN